MVVCHHCGYEWEYSGKMQKTTCPNCQNKTGTVSPAVPVHLVAYESAADLDVEYNDEGLPVIQNHDELVEAGKTYDEIRMLDRDSAIKNDLDIIHEDDPMWRDVFEDAESGDSWRWEELKDEVGE